MSPHVVSCFTDRNLLFSIPAASECHLQVITRFLLLMTFSAALF